MRRFLGSICGLVLLAVSVAWGGHIVLKQARLAHWPSADATVVSFDPGVFPGGEGYHWYANPKIGFRYKVAGVGYESQRLNPSPLNYQSRTRFEADTDGFKRGATIRCWYNPSQPGEAYVVNRGVTCDGVLIYSRRLPDRSRPDHPWAVAIVAIRSHGRLAASVMNYRAGSNPGEQETS